MDSPLYFKPNDPDINAIWMHKILPKVLQLKSLRRSGEKRFHKFLILAYQLILPLRHAHCHSNEQDRMRQA